MRSLPTSADFLCLSPSCWESCLLASAASRAPLVLPHGDTSVSGEATHGSTVCVCSQVFRDVCLQGWTVSHAPSVPWKGPRLSGWVTTSVHSRVPFVLVITFLLTFYFDTIPDLQESFKNSTKSTCVLFSQVIPLRVANILPHCPSVSFPSVLLSTHPQPSFHPSVHFTF